MQICIAPEVEYRIVVVAPHGEVVAVVKTTLRRMARRVRFPTRLADLVRSSKSPQVAEGEPERLLSIAGIDAVGISPLPRIFASEGYQVGVK
jgi:hypothetical protein